MTIRFTISELTDMFGVTARAVRFYEDKGLLEPAREGLTRVFSDRDRVRLGFIVQGRKVGFKLSEIKELLDLYQRENGREAQRRAALSKFKERVAQLEEQKREINKAIAEIQGWISALEAASGESGGGRRATSASAAPG